MWSSYDLDLDTRLSEETTVLVESYEVSDVSESPVSSDIEICTASGRTDNQDRFRAFRGTRMHVPTTPSRR